MNQEIMLIMDGIDYGYFGTDNVIYSNVDKDFSSMYSLQSPEETLKRKNGICWDQVELERELFEKNNIEFKTYFIVYYDNDKCPTHTFLIYKDHNEYCWFEHAWEKYRGIKKYNTEMEALKDVKQKFIKDELGNVGNSMNLCIYEYSKPKYGINVQSFYRHCEKGNNIIIQ